MEATGLMIKKAHKKLSLATRVECIKGLEQLILANFEELHRLYYDGLSDAETRRLKDIIESDGGEHYVIPK
jgi:hypothetical protein